VVRKKKFTYLHVPTQHSENWKQKIFLRLASLLKSCAKHVEICSPITGNVRDSSSKIVALRKVFCQNGELWAFQGKSLWFKTFEFPKLIRAETYICLWWGWFKIFQKLVEMRLIDKCLENFWCRYFGQVVWENGWNKQKVLVSMCKWANHLFCEDQLCWFWIILYTENKQARLHAATRLRYNRCTVWDSVGACLHCFSPIWHDIDGSTVGSTHSLWWYKDEQIAMNCVKSAELLIDCTCMKFGVVHQP
jgi:hypothetical protein